MHLPLLILIVPLLAVAATPQPTGAAKGAAGDGVDGTAVGAGDGTSGKSSDSRSAPAGDGAVDWLLGRAEKPTTRPVGQASTQPSTRSQLSTQSATQPATQAPVVPTSPFADSAARDRTGTLTLSDGTVLHGRVSTTAGRAVRVWVQAQERYVDLPWKTIATLRARVVWERDEPEWHFKESGSDVKVYTGRSYPARETSYDVTLVNGDTLAGGIVAPIYVSPAAEAADGAADGVADGGADEAADGAGETPAGEAGDGESGAGGGQAGDGASVAQAADGAGDGAGDGAADGAGQGPKAAAGHPGTRGGPDAAPVPPATSQPGKVLRPSSKPAASQPARPRMFVLHKRDKGEPGQRLTGLIYVKSVELN